MTDNTAEEQCDEHHVICGFEPTGERSWSPVQHNCEDEEVPYHDDADHGWKCGVCGRILQSE